MGEEYEIEQITELPEFVQLDPNSPFNSEFEMNLFEKEMEYLESNYLNQIEYLMEFSKFKVLKRMIIEQQYLKELMRGEDWSRILKNPLQQETLKMLV